MPHRKKVSTPIVLLLVILKKPWNNGYRRQEIQVGHRHEGVEVSDPD